jgi:hypothetical protein
MGLTDAITFHSTQLGKTVRVHGMRNFIASVQETGDHFSRVGGRGTGSQSLGRFGRPGMHPIWVACTTRAKAEALAEDLEALQLMVCAVKDQHGRTLPRVKVRSVQITVFTKTKGPAIGSTPTTYRIEAQMELERLPDA